MQILFLELSLFFVLCVIGVSSNARTRPNILVLIADDLGYADVGFNNRNVSTPNIDYLAKDNGIILTSYYTARTCSPSRASLLSGKFPHNVGINDAMLGHNPYGIDSRHYLLPQKLKEFNYHNILVGKWHVGYSKLEYTPLQKGFDEFFGMYGPMADHWTQTLEIYHDLRDNYDLHLNVNHTFSTQLYSEKLLEKLNNHVNSNNDQPFYAQLAYQVLHTPLGAPEKYLSKCNKIKNLDRYKFCGMLNTLDESVGNITKFLKDSGLWDNTLIFFTTDNGGQVWAGALNYPLRGGKNDVYEGGVKGVAFFSGGYLNKINMVQSSTQEETTFDGLMHISDIYPTLIGFINNTQYNNQSEFIRNNGLNGRDVSNNIIMKTCPSEKFIVIHNAVCEISSGFITAARMNQWKIIKGFAGDPVIHHNYDHLEIIGNDNFDRTMYWLTTFFDNDKAFIKELIREGRKFGRFWYKHAENGLYNIVDDPYEEKNLLLIDSNNEHESHQKIFNEILELVENTTDKSQEQYPHTHMDENFTYKCQDDACFFDSWLEGKNTTFEPTGFVEWYLRYKMFDFEFVCFAVVCIIFIGVCALWLIFCCKIIKRNF